MIVRSPYPDIAIPDVHLSAFVLRHADRLADKPALIDASTGQRVTYGALADAVRAVAASLAARGFTKGNIFGINAPSSPEFAVALLAAASLGGIVTTMKRSD